MCKLFVGADPYLYQLRARSLRLRGVATSLRLENLFWQVLEEIGARDGLSLSQLISRLHDELVAAGTEFSDSMNFTSFLRVCCGRYLALMNNGDVPSDTRIPLRSLDADAILMAEHRRRIGDTVRAVA